MIHRLHNRFKYFGYAVNFVEWSGMNVQIEPSWKAVLNEEFEKAYFKELTDKVRRAYLSSTVYPPPQLIFNAFKRCPFDAVKVVILGQDPYINQGEAQGLSFSVPDGVRIPPSLQNIYKEIKDDLGVEVPNSGNLERWAEQGVLLLNASLTVQAKQSNSHQGWGWEQFTDAVMQKLSDKKEHLVFLLWGRFAQQKGQLVDWEKHCILEAAHPSPFSAHNGFFGCKHFSQTNAYLKEHDQKPIEW